MTSVMALLFRSSVDSAARWGGELARLMPRLDIRVWPQIGDPTAIDYALVWRPEPGLLAGLPNLKLILSLGAGVDHIFADPQLPSGVPIVRLVDPYLTAAMSEYVVLQVLRLHRRDLDYQAQQQAGIWRELPQKPASGRSASSVSARSDRMRRASSPISGSRCPAGAGASERSRGLPPSRAPRVWRGSSRKAKSWSACCR
jgi:hypothetical protein